MEYTLEQLVEQLGIPPNHLEQFVEQHSPLDGATQLENASFWSDSQSSFLSEAIKSDDPWSIAAGQLDALLR